MKYFNNREKRMGDIADMMMDGTLDHETGEYLGEGDGFPRTARSMRRQYTKSFPKGMHGGRKPKDTKCPICDKMVRGQEGLKTHTKSVHK
jgi:hypothetical protein